MFSEYLIELGLTENFEPSVSLKIFSSNKIFRTFDPEVKYGTVKAFAALWVITFKKGGITRFNQPCPKAKCNYGRVHSDSVWW